MTQKLKNKMEEKKVSKIIIKKEDELTDVVAEIIDSPNERIILTFAEETDLLISPINLKVLLETGDENEKLIVAQIIKNPTGTRNAKLADLYTIDSPQFPEEDAWRTEEINRAKRLSPSKKAPTTKEDRGVEEEQEGSSDFKKRIDAAIAKSKSQKDKRRETEDDLLITLDEDLPSSESLAFEELTETEERQIEKKDLPKIDTNKVRQDSAKTTPTEKENKTEGLGKKVKGVFAGIGGFFRKIPLPSKIKKLAPIIGISILFLAVLIGIIYINTALLVRVRIYVEAKEVEIEQTFEGDENIMEIDFEEFRIPVKRETVEKSRSTDITATGTAFRGERATGEVNIFYFCDEEEESIDLPSGQSLSTGGKSYTLDTSTTVKCDENPTVAITAIEVGEEYNISTNQQFAFEGYSTVQLLAVNTAPITGGTMEEYTVLSKADVDNAVEELRKIAVEEGEGELEGLAGRWEIIPGSITSKVLPDSIRTNVSIGEEASNVNLSITTESSASYFLKEGFDDGVEEILTQKAREDNLFETDRDWDLELDEEIEKEISIVESNEQRVIIKLVARSAVKPRVETNEIIEELKEMNWEEGQDYLKSLEFSERETRVEFFPEWFPENLRRFPRRQGGILISIRNVN